MQKLMSKDKKGRILVNGGYKICNIPSNCSRRRAGIRDFGLDARGQRSEPVDRHLVARGDVRQPVRQRAGDGLGGHGIAA